MDSMILLKVATKYNLLVNLISLEYCPTTLDSNQTEPSICPGERSGNTSSFSYQGKYDRSKCEFSKQSKEGVHLAIIHLLSLCLTAGMELKPVPHAVCRLESSGQVTEIFTVISWTGNSSYYSMIIYHKSWAMGVACGDVWLRVPFLVKCLYDFEGRQIESCMSWNMFSGV